MRSRPSRSIVMVLCAALTLAVAACQSADDERQQSQRSEANDSEQPRDTPSPDGAATSGGHASPPGSADQQRPGGDVPTPRVEETIASGLTSPWEIAFLPDGSALVTERDTAKIKRVGPNGSVDQIGTVREVESSGSAGGEGGLLGIAISPTFQRDRYVFVYYTAAEENRVVRMRYANGGLGAQKVLLDGLEQASFHNGGRLTFGPDKMLYVTVGDAGVGDTAQDADSLNGKILRITPDGQPAPGNPADGSPVLSRGHRNPQGLAFDEADRLWASEFGQDTWDELNRIRPGRNYGWPEVEGRPEGGSRHVDPLAQWGTDEASPSGLAYADGTLWMAALQGERLWAIPTAGNTVTGEPKAFFTGQYGRLRSVVPAPDGSLWLTTSNTDGRGSPTDSDDRILRLSLSQ